jgi:ABC-type multidrug transport system ATPase subunit
MIEGMRTIDSGSATVAGVDVPKDPRGVKARIGIQLQASSFFDELSLVELLRAVRATCTASRWTPWRCWRKWS